MFLFKVTALMNAVLNEHDERLKIAIKHPETGIKRLLMWQQLLLRCGIQFYNSIVLYLL